MKKIIFTLSMLLQTAFCFAQNLVPNPSFEDTVACPINANQVPFATGWDNFGQSPDYFNSCSINPDYSVPFNWGGYQQAASGNAYTAFGTYISHIFTLNDVREFIGGLLSSPLAIGEKYFVSFKVSLSLSNQIQSNCACNHIGAMFSTVPYSWSNPAPVTNNPPIHNDSLITDTVGWTTIFGSFIADSAYQYIIIGNFYDDLNTDTLIIDGSNYCYLSYYYLDNVCVSTDSVFAATWSSINDDDEEIANLIKIFPNPAIDDITIQSTGLNEPFEITIYSSLGQELYHSKNIKDKHIKISIKQFDSSLLLISIRTKNNHIILNEIRFKENMLERVETFLS